MPAASHLVEKAVELYHQNDGAGASRILAGVLIRDPANRAARSWFTRVCPDPRERGEVLAQALRAASPGSRELRQNYLLLRRKLAPLQSVEAESVSQPAQPDLVAPVPGPKPSATRLWLNLPGGWVASGSVFFSLAMLVISLVLVVVQAGRQMAEQANYQTLLAERNALQYSYDSTMELLQASTVRVGQLQAQTEALMVENSELALRHQQLKSQFDALNGQYGGLMEQYSGLNNQYNDLESRAVVPPYIVISGREVDMTFYRTDRSLLTWKVGFDVLEGAIERGQRARADLFSFAGSLNPRYALDMTGPNQARYRVVDYRLFLDPGPFTQVMDEIYQQAPDEEAFLRETWNVISQLTTYAFDPNLETPRYPLETLLAGGGDCEDTSILYASMIRAAPVRWKVSFVYLDIDHPQAMVEPNHLAVAVDTGNRVYLIETTSKTSMQPYGSSVDGWYLAINP